MFNLVIIPTVIVLATAGPQLMTDAQRAEESQSIRALGDNAKRLREHSNRISSARTRWRVKVDAAQSRVAQCEENAKKGEPGDTAATQGEGDLCDVYRHELARAEEGVRDEAMVEAERLRAAMDPTIRRTEAEAKKLFNNPVAYRALAQEASSKDNGRPSKLQLVMHTLEAVRRFRAELDQLALLAAAGNLSAALKDLDAANRQMSADLPAVPDLNEASSSSTSGDLLETNPLASAAN
jgi:hypothetical protein